MIVKGASRSSASYCSKHLLRTDHNEQVEVLETPIWHEDTAQAVAESLHHFQRMSRLTEKGQKGLYCAHLDPDGRYEMTPQAWLASLDILESELGLSGQPRLLVKHLKDDREHLHVVWQRAKQLDDGKFVLVSDSYNYKHHELAARQMEVHLDHESVRGVFTGRDRDPQTGLCLDERPVARLNHRGQQSERIRAGQPGKEPKVIKTELAQLWQQSENGQAFKAGLTQAGYTLARGDKKAIYMVVDPDGEAYDLRRSLPGVKKKDLDVRLSDDPAQALPAVSLVREQLDREQGWSERSARDLHVDGQAQSETTHHTAWAREMEAAREAMAPETAQAVQAGFDPHTGEVRRPRQAGPDIEGRPAPPPAAAASLPWAQRLERLLPDDLPTLESLWQSEVARCFARVQAKARRVEDQARQQLERHRERRRRHREAEPQLPTGLLARLRQPGYERDVAAWQARDQQLHWRWLQLGERVKHVADYGREGIGQYPSKGEQLAQKWLRAERPELARKLDQGREQERLEGIERRRQEAERQQRERQRGPQRGPER